MISYLRSEFFRLLHYKWTYLFTAICVLLLVSANVVLAAVKRSDSSFRYANTQFAFGNFYSSIIVVFLLCVMVSLLVFGNENSSHTLKNSVSYGIPRGVIYIGKLIVQIVYALAAFAAITGLYVLSAYLLLENSGPLELEMLLRAALVCLPLFIFAIAAANCFSFLIESSGGAAAATMGLITAIPVICNMLGMRFEFFSLLADVLPWNMINSIVFDMEAHTLKFAWDASEAYRNYWLLGLLHTALISFTGYFLFRRKEIK